MIRIVLSTPGGSGPDLGPLSQFVNDHKPTTMIAAFAFVTKKGVEILLEKLNSPHWRTIDKRLIVGIAEGITEPAAVRLVRSQDGFAVRAYIPGGKLNQAALASSNLLHSKFMLFEGTTSESPALLYVSSANLTNAALGAPPSNYECGQITLLSDQTGDAPVAAEIRTWWNGCWRSSAKATDAFLQEYAEARSKFLSTKPYLLQRLQEGNDIAIANTLWIEAGKASGIQRHQIEFPFALATFFGRPAQARTDVTLINGASSWSQRPLSYKTTTYGVEIWRLGMPTLAMGGEPIQDRIVRFERQSAPGTFKYDVADPGSPKSKRWEKESSLSGCMGQTHGANPRKYGYI